MVVTGKDANCGTSSLHPHLAPNLIKEVRVVDFLVSSNEQLSHNKLKKQTS